MNAPIIFLYFFIILIGLVAWYCISVTLYNNKEAKRIKASGGNPYLIITGLPCMPPIVKDMNTLPITFPVAACVPYYPKANNK